MLLLVCLHKDCSLWPVVGEVVALVTVILVSNIIIREGNISLALRGSPVYP